MLQSVRPDAEIKSCPKYCKCWPKSSYSRFHSKVMFLQVAQKTTIHLGHFLRKKIVAQNFEKLPNLVTLVAIDIEEKCAFQLFAYYCVSQNF